MIPREYLIDNEEYLKREELKAFYLRDPGVYVLRQKILMSGLLSEITDQEGVIAHNLCIKELEELGVLDEEGLESLIRYLLTREPDKRPVSEGDYSA